MGMVVNPYRFAAAGGPTDPHWSSVKLLIGANGTNGSTTIIDESSTARTLTVNGNAQISTAQSKFGGSSLLFDGSGDYVTAPDSADWHFGPSSSRPPFTVEGWFRFNSKQTNQALLAQMNDNGSATDTAFIFYINGTGILRFRIYNPGNRDLDASFSPTLGTWYHIAWDRDGTGKSRLYVDGVMLASTTVQNVISNDSPLPLSIGRLGGAATVNSAFDFNGNMDEVRFTNGVARYASDSGYTVPTAAFPRS